MNILRITAQANPEKELELKQALKSALDKTTKYKDVKNCCCKSIFEENIFHVEQEWENSSSLQSYLQSKEFQYLIGAITVLGNLLEQKIINAASVEDI
jgi:quinol monooxygenase YgiN